MMHTVGYICIFLQSMQDLSKLPEESVQHLLAQAQCNLVMPSSVSGRGMHPSFGAELGRVRLGHHFQSSSPNSVKAFVSSKYGTSQASRRREGCCSVFQILTVTSCICNNLQYFLQLIVSTCVKHAITEMEPTQ